MSVGSIYKSSILPNKEQQDDGVDSLPLSLIPARISRALPSKKSMKQIYAVSGVTSGPGQTSIIQFPNGANAGYLTAGSCYFFFKLTVTQASNSYGFKGSAPSAQSLINRLTVSCGSQLESINNYGMLCTNIISPFSSSNSLSIEPLCAGGFGLGQYKSDSYVNSLTTSELVTVPNTNYTFDATGTVAYKYTLPIISGVLAGGSESNSIPLLLMQSPLTIMVDWQTVAGAFFGATVAPTNYAISEFAIVYESVEVGEQYNQSVRSALASGKFWSVPFSTVVSVQTAYTSSLSYNMSLNCSSLSAFFYGVIINANSMSSGLTSGWFSASNGSTQLNDSTNITRRLYADGNAIYQIPNYNSDALLVRELCRALSGQINPDSIVIPCQTLGNYNQNGTWRGEFYLVSFNCRSFNDSSVCLSGIPCSILNIQTTDLNSGLNAGDVINMFAIVDQILVIDQTGSCSLIK